MAAAALKGQVTQAHGVIEDCQEHSDHSKAYQLANYLLFQQLVFLTIVKSDFVIFGVLYYSFLALVYVQQISLE